LNYAEVVFFPEFQASIFHAMMTLGEGCKNNWLRILLLKVLLEIVLGKPDEVLKGTRSNPHL